MMEETDYDEIAAEREQLRREEQDEIDLCEASGGPNRELCSLPLHSHDWHEQHSWETDEQYAFRAARFVREEGE